MEKKFALVSMELMQETVRYLESKPFLEVHKLIAGILKEANAPVVIPPAVAEEAQPEEVKE